MASPWTPTHPSQAYQPSLMMIDAFKLTLESALDNMYAEKSPSSYDNVRVLLLHWEHTYDTDDENYAFADLALQLAKVFRESYKYSVTTQILGSSGKRSPILSHNRPGSPCYGEEGDDSLVIVYYIGQGDMVGNDLYIYPSQVRREQEINFSEVYSNAVQGCKTDILTFLDCPYFGDKGGTRPDPGGKREIMAATGDIGSNMSKDWSFTKSLIRELQHAADTKQILTTPQLYARIAINTAPSGCSEDEKRSTSPLPLHLHNDHHQGPIHLSPLHKSRPPPTPILPPGSTWKPAPYALLLHQPLTVLLSANLHGHNHHSLQQSLRHWAYKQSCSPISLGAVDRIRIMDAYQSSPSSSTLLFQVTMDVWDTLPSHPAIQFLTFNMGNPQSIPKPPSSSCSSKATSSASYSSKSSGYKSNSPLLRSEINRKYRISWLRSYDGESPQQKKTNGKFKENQQIRERRPLGSELTKKKKTLVKINKGLHRRLKPLGRRCLMF